MADTVYYNFVTVMASGALNWTSDTLKCALLNSGYVPNSDHTYWSNVSGYQLSAGNGYTSGGATVTGTVSSNTSLNKSIFDISDPTWTASGGAIGPFRYGALYDDTSATKPLIYLFDFSTDQTANNGADITIQVSSSGLLTIGE
jgi:hypothetical protein